MSSIVDLGSLSNPVNTLIEKVSNGIGWIANRKTYKKLALDSFISDIEKSNLDPVEKAVLISYAPKVLKEAKNQESILDIAIEHLKSDAHPEKIDDDWLSQFMDKARLVSNEEFQIIWGRILADECNEVGSVKNWIVKMQRPFRNCVNMQWTLFMKMDKSKQYQFCII